MDKQNIIAIGRIDRLVCLAGMLGLASTALLWPAAGSARVCVANPPPPAALRYLA